jgi:hypothetical protein
MKGVSVILGSAIVIVIAITAAYLALNLGNPSTNRVSEMLLLQEGKDNLVDIDNAIVSVSQEGQGSTRNLRVAVTGGYYSLIEENATILFSMDSPSQIIGIGVSRTEDSVNMRGKPGKVFLNLSYSNYNITGSLGFGEGTHNIIIRNEGYDSINEKQMVSISV